MIAVATDRYGVRIAGTNFRFELVVALAIAVFVLVQQRLAPARRIGVVEACLVGWLFVAIFSSLLFSPARTASLKQTLLLAGLLLIYAVTLALLRSTQDIVRAAWTWVAVGGAVAAVGLLESAAYILAGSQAGISLEGSLSGGALLLLPKVTSTMWEPNIFGSFELTVWAMGFVLALAPRTPAPAGKWLLRSAMALACCGIVISISRADWLLILILAGALALIAILLRLAPGRDVAKQLIPSAIGIGVGIALGLLMQVEACPANQSNASGGASSSISQSGAAPQTIAYSGCVNDGSDLVRGVEDLLAPGTTSSATGRVSVVRQALNGWLSRPVLGWGTNAYAYVYGPAGGSWIGNLELHVLFDTGVVGLLLLLGAVVAAGRRGLSSLMTPPAKWTDAHFTLLGAMAGVSALLVAYQFTDGTWLGFTWVLFAILVAGGRFAAPSPSWAGVELRPSPSVDQSAEKSAPVPVTIAVVNWNSGPDLLDCIEAVKRNTRVAWKLVVVDNASTDDSVSRVNQAIEGVRVVSAGRNLGFAGGVNLALEQIETPFVLLLNPDAFVMAGCVDALVARAHASGRAAAIGSGLRNPNGSLQVAVRNFPTPLTHLIEAFRLYQLLRYVPGLGRWYLLVSKQKEARRVDWVVGACLLLRLAAVRDVGPFDDSFFMYSEELDWCLRAHRKGWEIWFEPEAVATHRLGGSSRQNELPLMIESYRSMYRFYAKYYPPSWTAAARAITWAAMTARALALPFRRDRGAARLAAYREITRL